LYLRFCLKEDSYYTEALFELARCHELMKKPEESVKLYLAFINREPFSCEAWYNLGNVYDYLERNEDAIDAYEYAFLIKEDFADAYYNRGNTLFKMHFYKEAIENYELSIDHSKKDAITLCNIGECHEELEDTIQARKFYKQATKLNPKNSFAWFGIGNTYVIEKKWQDGIQYIEKALRIDKENGDYWATLAHTQHQLGNLDIAENAFRKSFKFEPTNIKPWIEFSFLLLKSNRTEEAVALLKEGINKNPDNAKLYYMLAVYLIMIGNEEDSYCYFEHALDMDFNGHSMIMNYLPKLKWNETVTKLIAQYKK